MNRIVLNMFNQIDFRCSKCDANFKSGEVEAHKNDCLLKNKCVLGCGNQKFYQGYEEITKHLIDNCVKVNMLCEDCDERITRKDVGTHDCIGVFKRRIK